MVGDDNDEFIEEMIDTKGPIEKVLRLLILKCIANQGLREKNLNHFRERILKQYGFEYLSTLKNLEKLGLLAERGSQNIYPFSKVIDHFNCSRDVSLQNPNQIDYAYVHGSFAPISVCFVEAAIKENNLSNSSSVLKLIHNGPVVIQQQTIQSSKNKKELNIQDVYLIFYIGGITYSEISALRNLSRSIKKSFIIATTSIINGSKFIKNLFDVGNDLQVFEIN